ncbi:MAG: arabinogalactan endo-1,4-beta-galactosidase [Anaerolineales bacterium]|nr:arabinogalactan endo-1,4-beta-galactosidase [Anaerolineales bacterium]
MDRKARFLGLGILLLWAFSACSAEGSPALPTPSVEPIPAIATVAPTPGPAALQNPGFEQQDEKGLPTGWLVQGDVQAVRFENNGHSGQLRLSHTSNQAYRVETSQTVEDLADGWYTLRAWTRSSGNNETYLALACGKGENRVYVPSSMPGYRWIQLVVSAEVRGGTCVVRLVSFGLSGSWVSFDDIELVPGRAALSVLGADISSLKKSEDLGGVYRYSDGTPADALQIMKDSGLNYARLRIWLDPADGYHNKTEILAMAQRLKQHGIKLLVDFHYSDDWADPGKQNKPAAWQTYDFEQLKQAVYDHTHDVCTSLVAQGTPPDMVQVGNEINAGILWPDGSYNQMDNLAALLTSGYQAVKDCSPSTRVMLHIAEGGKNDMARWFFDNLTRRNVPFDVIGVSFYPYWHGSLAQLQVNLNDISARYDKDVLVAEFAYPFTPLDQDGYPNLFSQKMMIDGYLYTPEGQRQMMRDILSIIRAVQNGRGLGLFYWDATWTAVPGNGWDTKNPKSGNPWENQALFDFEGRILPAFAEYLNP